MKPSREKDRWRELHRYRQRETEKEDRKERERRETGYIKRKGKTERCVSYFLPLLWNWLCSTN